MMVKIVRVRYTMTNRPNRRKIERTIMQWSQQGYTFSGRVEHKSGCAILPWFLTWARGSTELTFLQER